MAFIDLMAYARGAEMANKANWQDVMNDLDVRRTEEALRQSQTTYNLGLPLAQENSRTAMEAIEGNRRAADFQTSVFTELAKMPREQQADFVVQSAMNRLQNLDGTRPGAAQEAQGIQTYLTRLASDYAKAGDTASAQKILGAMPGANVGQKLVEIDRWSNPATALNPQNIAGAGGKMLPDGNVEFMGYKMTPAQFAQMQQQRAQNANVLPGLQNLGQQQQMLAMAEQVAQAYRNAGFQVAINPITGQVTPLPAAAAPAAPAAVGVPNPAAGMTMAPPTAAQTALAGLAGIPAAAPMAAPVMPAPAMPRAPAATPPWTPLPVQSTPWLTQGQR
jgi:hypothetical protein